MIKFSIIMPVYLGSYRQAGQDREAKLLRAVNSALNQNYGLDYEIVIISDGCEKTIELVTDNFDDDRVQLFQIQKQKPFSGSVRNAGLARARGEWITYLDSDDVYGTDHLSIIDEQLNGFDWVFFNDMVYNGRSFEERTCTIKMYACGTSNIAHKRTMAARWGRGGYGRDDWEFINALRTESKKWKKINTPEYVVCHVPKWFDV